MGARSPHCTQNVVIEPAAFGRMQPSCEAKFTNRDPGPEAMPFISGKFATVAKCGGVENKALMRYCYSILCVRNVSPGHGSEL